MTFISLFICAPRVAASYLEKCEKIYFLFVGACGIENILNIISAVTYFGLFIFHSSRLQEKQSFLVWGRERVVLKYEVCIYTTV